MKRFLYYFGWTIVIGFIIYLGSKYQVHLENEARKAFEIMPVILFTTLFPIVIGLFLRLPTLIIEMKQNRPWTFDWIKFIAIGLPALVIISMFILPFTPFGEGVIKVSGILWSASPNVQIIAGIVLGYIFLDSLKKG